MNKLALDWTTLRAKTLGRLLEEITFPEGNIFAIRKDATPWSEERVTSRLLTIIQGDSHGFHAAGYTFKEGDLRIEVFRLSEADSDLEFSIIDTDGQKREISVSPHKTDDWQDRNLSD